MMRKWSAEHGQYWHPNPKFLVTVNAYLSATFGSNISGIFDLCYHLCSYIWPELTEYTAIPYRASTGPEQGFPCEEILTGKNLFSLQGTLF